MLLLNCSPNAFKYKIHETDLKMNILADEYIAQDLIIVEASDSRRINETRNEAGWNLSSGRKYG